MDHVTWFMASTGLNCSKHCHSSKLSFVCVTCTVQVMQTNNNFNINYHTHTHTQQWRMTATRERGRQATRGVGTIGIWRTSSDPCYAQNEIQCIIMLFQVTRSYCEFHDSLIISRQTMFYYWATWCLDPHPVRHSSKACQYGEWLDGVTIHTVSMLPE